MSKPKNHYFDNSLVEKLLVKYHETGCTDIELRNEIMEHAGELIVNVIRTHNLHNIYMGKDESAFNDLYQIAWCSIESTLYKFNNEPGHPKLFNMWCMTPDTMLLTTDGIQELADVSLGMKSKVYGLEGMNEVEAGLVKPEIKTLKLTTDYNYQVECTPEHQLLTLEGDMIDFRETSQIKVGDLVGLQFNQNYFVGNDDISDIELESSGDWIPPKEFNECLSYILGLYIAEGSYSYNYIDIYNTDEDAISKLQNNNIGLNFKYYKESQVIRLSNKKFVEFLKKLGFGKGKAHHKYIPHRLLKMSKANMISMLSGMFDGDGGSSRHDGVVTYTTTSSKLVNQVRMLMLNFGIVTKLSIDNRDTSYFNKNGKEYNSKRMRCYQLIMSSEYSNKFYNTIGFHVKRKQNKNKSLPEHKIFINSISDQFKKLYDKHGLCDYNYNKVRPLKVLKPRRELNKIIEGLEIYSEFSDDDNYKFIQDRVDEVVREHDNILWLRVKGIEESKSKVCEISVNSNTHSYIANGIISHNSQISRTAILAAIKKDNRDRKNSENYRYYLDEQIIKTQAKFKRFINEAREICKYCKDLIHMLDSLEELYAEDPKPHEGFINKLTNTSKMSRSKVTKFIKFLKLLSFEITDSPVGESEHQDRPVKPSEIAFTKDQD